MYKNFCDLNKIKSLFIINTNALQRKFSTNVLRCENDLSDDKVKSFDSIPGPKPMPIFGYLWHIMPYVGAFRNMDPDKVHIRLQKEYGNIVRLRDLKFTDDVVLCYDPKDIETVFRSEGPWPKRNLLPSLKYYREVLRKEEYGGYGGVFTSEGEQWQQARSVSNTLLMQPRVVKHYFKPFSEVADDFVNRIDYLRQQNNLNEMPEDFIKEIMKWALESVGILALGSRFGLLNSEKSLPLDKTEYIDNVVEFFELMYVVDILPSLSKFITTPTWKRYIAVLDSMTYFVIDQIKIAKKNLEKERDTKKDINDMSIIEKLLNKYGEKYLLGNTMDILAGGVDTTSKALSRLMYLLAIHPDKQIILREEINKYLPNKNDELTAEILEKMSYLKAVIKESFRVMPLILGLSRQISKDLVLSGYHIPKNTNVLMEQLAILTNEDNFVEADKFIPERWLRKDRKPVDINPWLLLPFGFGPRSCSGQRIAQLELEILLVKILRKFQLEWHHEPAEFEFRILSNIKSPLKYRMIPLNPN